MPEIYKKNYDDDDENFEFEEYSDNDGLQRSEFVTSDDITISYQYCDKRNKNKCGCYENDCRPSVILLHDIGYDSNYWLCFLKKLCPVANVFALDNPGAGQSCNISADELTLNKLTQNLVDFLDELNLNKVYLVGQGFGGLIALNFAFFYPDYVIKVAVSSVNPSYFPIPGSTWTYYITPELQQLISQFLAPNANLEVLALAITNLIDPIDCDGKLVLVNQYINQIQQYKTYIPILESIDLRATVAQITVPVLIMNGTKNPLVPAGAAIFLRNTIPNSALVEFYNQGNNFPILNTDLYNETVFNFFFVKCDPCCAFFETIEEPKKDCKCICVCEKYKKLKICDICDNFEDNFYNYENKIVIPCRYT